MITQADKANLVVGLKQVRKALSSGLAKRVYLANDCEPAFLNEISSILNTTSVEVFYIDTMAELGSMCGIACKASCAAVC